MRFCFCDFGSPEGEVLTLYWITSFGIEYWGGVRLGCNLIVAFSTMIFRRVVTHSVQVECSLFKSLYQGIDFCCLGISANTDTSLRQKGKLGQAPVPIPPLKQTNTQTTDLPNWGEGGGDCGPSVALAPTALLMLCLAGMIWWEVKRLLCSFKMFSVHNLGTYGSVNSDFGP